MISFLKFAPSALALLVCGLAGSVSAADQLTKVRMTFDDDMVVTQLADRLGYFKQEGIEIVDVDLMTIAKEDYLMQEPLVKGQIDAAEHWFNHTIFGARHGFPIQAVMMLDDAPAMKVIVANRVKDQIHSAADFKGRVIAEGAGYATKAVITGYMAHQAGLPRKSYTSINHPTEGRLPLVLADLRADKLDVMTFQEPISSGILDTGLATTLYDLTTREGTVQALGTAFPAQSILVSPQFVQEHPDTVQHLVNAYVRAMRFINAHTPDEIIAQLPAGYVNGKNRAAQLKTIRASLPSYAKGDYAFPADAVHLVVDAMLWAKFDSSEEGMWRATGDISKVVPDELYTNRFVNQAMQQIK